MTRRAALDMRDLVAAAAAATLAGMLCLVGLWAIARPSSFTLRLAAVDRQVGEAERLLAAPGDAYAYSDGALCSRAPGLAADTLGRRLQDAAKTGNLTLANLSVRPGASNEALAGLTAVTIQFDAQGRYDAVLTFLAELARSKPEVFIDTIDLKSQTSAVALSLKGRVFCSTSAAR